MVIGVMLEDSYGNPPDLNDLLEWKNTYGLSYPVMVGSSNAWRTYRISGGVPTNYVIDRSMIVQYAGEGFNGDAIRNMVLALLEGGDTEPPYVTDQDPAPGETNVPTNTEVRLKIRDDLSGPEITSVVFTIYGHTYDYYNTADDFGTLQIIGGTKINLTFIPTFGFPPGTEIGITVEADDKWNPPNHMVESYSFFTEGAAPTPTSPPYTPTQPPYTPTPTPTTAPGTPTYTPTPTQPPSTDVRLELEMPQTYFRPGDTFYLNLKIYNNSSQYYTNMPLFVALNIGEEYWFYPHWVHYPPDIDYEFNNIPVGESSKVIIQSFNWPSGVGSMSGLKFIAAFTNQEMTELFGQMDMIEFGFGE